MVKSFSKKHFIKRFLKSKEIVNTVTNMETQIVRIITFLAQYTNKKFYEKLIYLRNRVSCYNLFLVHKRKLRKYLTLQKTIMPQWSFLNFGPVAWAQIWKSAPKPPPPHPQKGKISNLFLSKLYNWRYGISKMISLSRRKLRETKLMWVFQFWTNGPKYKYGN